MVIALIIETALLIALLVPDIRNWIDQEKAELIEQGRQMERGTQIDTDAQNSCLWWLAHVDDYYDVNIKEKRR